MKSKKIAKIPRDFVATVYIAHKNKILLVFHKKMQRWLPPGGHVDENELPDDAVLREAKEETGLDIEIVGKKFKSFRGIKPLHNPFFIQLEDIEKKKDELHQHIDLVYLAKPKTYKIKFNGKETEKIKWFSISEMKKHKVPKDVIHKAEMILKK